MSFFLLSEDTNLSELSSSREALYEQKLPQQVTLSVEKIPGNR
jgi:hypothetical protein